MSKISAGDETGLVQEASGLEAQPGKQRHNWGTEHHRAWPGHRWGAAGEHREGEREGSEAPSEAWSKEGVVGCGVWKPGSGCGEGE